MENLLVVSLNWNRVYLEILFNKNIEGNVYLLNGNTKYEICSDYINDNKISMPITCAYGDEIIKEGNWYFVCDDKKIKLDINEAKLIDSKDKVFFYKNGKFSYLVTFDIDEEFNLIMKTTFMKHNSHPKRNNYGGKTKIVGLFMLILKGLLRIEYSIISLFSRKNNRILFMSETRSGLEGNLLALNTRIKELGMDKDYKIIYSFKRVLSERKSLLYFFKATAKIAKAGYIFIDDYAPTFNFLKLKNTKLIQLWHAGIGFKSVGYSRFGKDGSPHPYQSTHRKYTYASVASSNLIPVYEEVFGLTKNHFIVPGMLRLDGYLNQDKQNSVKERLYNEYPLIKGKKVILFAPTYRGVGQADAYYDLDKIDVEALNNLCINNNYVVLFKFHPFIKNRLVIDEKYKCNMIDVSNYKDINELFYVTDVLITDYSSNIYEYSLFERPIIFFDYDMDEYAIKRGVHEPLEESPGNICKSFDDVLNVLENNTFNIDKVKEFKNKYIMYTDDKSCDRLINIVFKNNK